MHLTIFIRFKKFVVSSTVDEANEANWWPEKSLLTRHSARRL